MNLIRIPNTSNFLSYELSKNLFVLRLKFKKRFHSILHFIIPNLTHVIPNFSLFLLNFDSFAYSLCFPSIKNLTNFWHIIEEKFKLISIRIKLFFKFGFVILDGFQNVIQKKLLPPLVRILPRLLFSHLIKNPLSLITHDYDCHFFQISFFISC